MSKNAEKTVIPHNPKLPTLLKNQHQTLMSHYKDTLMFADAKKYPELNKSLHHFSESITNHFRDERELYMYLEYVVSNNDGTYRDTRTEMKDIALIIKSLINLHINTPVTEGSIDKFYKDFSLIGKELLGRMRYEETHLFKDYSKK